MKKLAIILALVFLVSSCAVIDHRYTAKRVRVEPAEDYEEYYDSLISMFFKTVDFLAKCGERERMKYLPRLEKVVKNARNLFERRKERETPIDLLKSALKQLNHENMRPANVAISNYSEAMKIAREIQNRANDIEHEFYGYQKQFKSLADKNN